MSANLRAGVAAFDAVAMSIYAYLQTGGFGNPGIDLMLWGSAAAAAVAAFVVATNGAAVLGRIAIGGEVVALVYDARTRQVTAYNGSGAAPGRIEAESFGHGFGDRGVTLATVPGCVAAWGDILADQGRLGIDRVLEPAIGYAAEGFPVSTVLSAAIAEETDRLAHDDTASHTY